MSSFSFDIIDTYKEEFLPAKCIVHFRPKADWKGKGYGFDWMRIGDTGEFGDMQPYKDIVGKQYHNDETVKDKDGNPIPGLKGTLVKGVNEYNGDFPPDGDKRDEKKDKALYKSLQKKYQQLIIAARPPSANREYYCPWLSLFPETIKEKKIKPASEIIAEKGKFSIDSLFTTETKAVKYPNTEAELRLYLEMEEKPDYLEFEDNEHFEITTGKKISDGLKAGFLSKTVKIKCKVEFDKDQAISIYACKKNTKTGKDEKKLAGRLWVWANNKWRRKVYSVLMVKIKTPTISGTPSSPNLENEKNNLNQYLSQALVQVKIEKVIDLDLSADTNFKIGASGFISDKKINRTKQIGLIFKTSLMEYLEGKVKEKLKDDWKKYAKTFKFYYFEEPGTNGKKNIGGFQSDETGDVVIFKNPSATTASHELFHKLRLAHSFSNSECSTDYKALHTYKARVTDNVMDYSTGNCSLWYWQWEVANKNA